MARKAKGVARSNSTRLQPSVPLSASPLTEYEQFGPNYGRYFAELSAMPGAIETIRGLTIERQTYLTALGDLMCFYNRVTEPGYGGHGWTAADVVRLQEIRQLLMPPVRVVI